MRPDPKYTSDSDLESVFSNEETKTAKYVCRFKCGKSFKRVVALDRHEFTHTGIKKFQCDYEGCDKSYSNGQHLKRHIRVFHEKQKSDEVKNVKCSFDFCEKMFLSTYSMERHIREAHENPKVYQCSECGEKFSQRLKLRRHEVKHTGVYPFNCSKCSKGFVQEYFLVNHKCKTYRCEECQIDYAKWSQLLAHRKELNHKQIHKCDQCSKTFKTNFFLTEHKNCHEDDKEVFKCTHEGCNRFYNYRRNLLQHIHQVHENKKLKCTVENCEMALSNKRALEHHVKVIHNKKNVVAAEPKAKKPRAIRKDAGKPRQSTLSLLSGVVIDKDIDRMIMDGSAAVDIDLEALAEEIEEGLEATAEASAAEDN